MPAQDRAARLLAIGYTQQMTADELRVNIRTIQNWCARPAFYDYVDELARLAWQRVEPGIMANIALANDVVRRMLIGEISASDKRYIEARRLIDRVLDRALYVESPAAEGGTSAASVTVPIQINTGGAQA